MVEQIDTHGLRELLRAPLGSGTHGDISTRFEALGVSLLSARASRQIAPLGPRDGLLIIHGEY
ncbi:Uncharacterised protein [Mycobacteroides abscessus subsp. abscessus]|nr:Uncharacterised protein [Mycobacteroides abscessus subsp. abscessus]